MEPGSIIRINKTQLYGIVVCTYNDTQIIIIWENGKIDLDAKLKIESYDILWIDEKHVKWYYDKKIIPEELTYHHLEYLSEKINFNKIKRREKLKQINEISK